MDADTDRQPDACVPRQARIELSHSRHQAKTGAYRPLGVIFMRLRIAKVHQEAIAQILRDIAAEALDHRRTGFLVGPHYLPQVLRVELDSESRRVHEIAEHHCKLAPFGFRHASHDVGGLSLWGLLFLGVRLLCGLERL